MTLIRLVTLGCIVFLISCGEKAFFEQNKAIANEIWKWEDVVEFDVPVTDTVIGYNFILNLRTTKAYEFSNIYVFVNLKFPDGRMITDTVSYDLMDDAGFWYGKPSGSLVENNILFSYNRIFPISGNYHFTIAQGMRNRELTEVTDVGLRIEQTKRK